MDLACGKSTNISMLTIKLVAVDFVNASIRGAVRWLVRRCCLILLVIHVMSNYQQNILYRISWGMTVSRSLILSTFFSSAFNRILACLHKSGPSNSKEKKKKINWNNSSENKSRLFYLVISVGVYGWIQASFPPWLCDRRHF